MNVLILSDLHANYAAIKPLKSAVAEADLVLCLGDLVGYYCQVNEVLDFVRGVNTICVRGNHDEYLLSGCPLSASEAVRFGIEYADHVIHADHRRWIAALPLVWGGVLDHLSVLMSHGSPFRPLTDYLYPNRIANFPLDQFDFDALAFGQTHLPFVDSSRRPLLLNPGSVGQSRNSPGVACAARLVTNTKTVELLQHSYDTQEVIDLAVKNGAQEWIRKHMV
jgi:predicted phosphodiesterase